MCSSTVVHAVAPYDVTITADFSGNVMARPATVENGDNLTLTCTASGGPNNMFYWFKDDEFLDQSTDGVLNIADITATDGGMYECVVNNTAGGISDNITIYGRICISHDTIYNIVFLFSCSTVYYCARRYRRIRWHGSELVLFS